jgi:hypothetical protein
VRVHLAPSSRAGLRREWERSAGGRGSNPRQLGKRERKWTRFLKRLGTLIRFQGLTNCPTFRWPGQGRHRRDRAKNQCFPGFASDGNWKKNSETLEWYPHFGGLSLSWYFENTTERRLEM